MPTRVRDNRVAMSAKASASTPAPQASAPTDIRNVVLVGHSGAGKTTLFEHLIAATTPDYRPKPVAGERSVQLAVASVSFLLAALFIHRRWVSRIFTFLILGLLVAAPPIMVYRVELGLGEIIPEVSLQDVTGLFEKIGF